MDSTVIEQTLDFLRSKLLEFEQSENSGLIGVDIPIVNGLPTGAINTKVNENRKAVKKRERFPVS